MSITCDNEYFGDGPFHYSLLSDILRHEVLLPPKGQKVIEVTAYLDHRLGDTFHIMYRKNEATQNFSFNQEALFLKALLRVEVLGEASSSVSSGSQKPVDERLPDVRHLVSEQNGDIDKG